MLDFGAYNIELRSAIVFVNISKIERRGAFVQIKLANFYDSGSEHLRRPLQRETQTEN
jgi:hypothetical protein